SCSCCGRERRESSRPHFGRMTNRQEKWRRRRGDPRYEIHFSRRLGGRTQAVDDEAVRAVERIDAVAGNPFRVRHHTRRVPRVPPYPDLVDEIAIPVEAKRLILQ